jgi:DNA-binding LacI/PurR family transcriptional regulator
MTGQGRSTVKLAVIAREVGVSLSTVSKVVNGRADVAASTRARVREALARHSYPLPSSSAAYTKRHAALLDVVIHEVDSAWAGTLLDRVQRAAAERGLNVVLSTVQPDSTPHVPARRWLDQIAARGTCGVLGILAGFTTAQVDYMRDQGIPCVVIDPRSEPDPNVATVRIDNHDSQYRLTEHLIALGHKRIAMVSGNRHSLPARERLAGFEAAMADARLPIRPEWRREGGFDQSRSRAAMAALMALPEPPTAIAFASDKGALAGLAEANRLGLKVPDDVSITGFDDVPDAASAVPALTTVRQPVAAMVDAALRHLIGKPEPGAQIKYDTELIERESTAPPRP